MEEVMNKYKMLFGMVLFFLFSINATAFGKPVSAQAFADQVVRVEYIYVGLNGGKFRMLHRQGGIVYFQQWSGSFHDEGVWEVVGEKICYKWERYLNNREYYCNSKFGIDGDIYTYIGANGKMRKYMAKEGIWPTHDELKKLSE
jgi:hypothetical protein